ncbi:PA2778 family cysteine peptidase [Marinobacter sp. 1Y8]
MNLHSMTAHSRAVPVILLMLIMAGCAATPDWPTAANGSPELRLQGQHQIDSVPFYPQEQFQCGPASLAMMLNAQGLDADPETLKSQVYIPAREGSLQVEMVAAARNHDLLVYPLDGTLESLLAEVAAGHPVLVLQNLRFDWWPQWHFAVVIGFDSDDKTITLHTGTQEAAEEPLSVFSATWARSDHWAVTMLPPDQLPVSAKPLPFLRAANDLETTDHTEAAYTAYATANAKWPDQPAALLGMGNIAYANEDWPDAVNHYNKLTTEFPRIAAGWNNFAQALQEANCPDAAAKASACAAQLDSDRFSASPESGGISVYAENCPTVAACPAGE